MSEEDQQKALVKRKPWIAFGIAIGVLFVGVVGFLISQGLAPNLLGFLGNPVVAGVVSLTVLIGVILVVVYQFKGNFLKNKLDFSGGRKSRQLSKKEADLLSKRYFWNEGILIGSSGGGRTEYLGQGEDEDGGQTRIYQRVVKPKNLDKKMAIVFSLEQELSLDDYGKGSLDQALRELNDLTQVDSEFCEDSFQEELKSAKNNLAGAREPVRQVTRFEDGEPVREVTERGFQNQRVQASENQQG